MVSRLLVRAGQLASSLQSRSVRHRAALLCAPPLWQDSATYDSVVDLHPESRRVATILSVYRIAFDESWAKDQ